MIAAERTLQIRTQNGDISVPVHIEVPVLDRTAWTCRFTIGWPEGEARGYATAFDAVQALQFAMQRIAMLLYISPHHQSRALYFDVPGEGYGFPLPTDSRNLAIGDDKTL